MDFLQHRIFVDRTFFKFHKYKLKNFRQASKLSDKCFSGGAMAACPPPGHGATASLFQFLTRKSYQFYPNVESDCQGARYRQKIAL